MATPKVYEAINAVSAELAKVGISKDRKASGGGASYSFRGIDDVYRVLAPLLSENKLCLLPEVLERDVVERTAKSGASLFYVAVKVKFTFVSSEDGSKHEIATYGEAMDSSDKATNKAMSAAYKYAAFLSFCIPTEGDNDTENAHHEVRPKTLDERKSAFLSAVYNAKTSEDLEAIVRKGSDLLLSIQDGNEESYNEVSSKITAKRTELKGK